MSLRPMDSEFKRAMAPSFALLTLAALTPSSFDIYLEDENVSSINLEDTPDLVAITVNIDSSIRAYEISEAYRKRGIKVIMGGIHPSVLPDESLMHADSICIGEVEELWEIILQDFSRDQLKRIYYNENITDLAKIPLPRFDIINKNDYLYTNISFTSRGCPFQCQFCYNSARYVHNKFRNRPIKTVIEEVKALNNKHIMFLDDNFIGNINWTKEFLKELKPLKLKWNVACSTNIVNHPDLLDQMQECGCRSLFIGFETINQYTNLSANKAHNNVLLYEKLISELHKRDIMVNASIVFGFDNDTKDVFKNTLEWLIKNKVETVTAHILTPYPGTKLFDKLDQEGRIFDKDWSHYNTSQVVFAPLNMTKEELFNGYLWLYDEFYTYRNIFKRLPLTKGRFFSFLLFNLIYRKYGKITCRLTKLGHIGKAASFLSYLFK